MYQIFHQIVVFIECNWIVKTMNKTENKAKVQSLQLKANAGKELSLIK